MRRATGYALGSAGYRSRVRVAPELVVLPDADAAARRGAAVLAAAGRAAIAERGGFDLAVSGGSGPLAMFDALDREEVAWDHATLWQVDERVAPDGDPDRNLTGLIDHLPDAALGAIRPMPVTATDLASAATGYGAGLPEAFDLLHLGLGADGHTASLVPGDPVLEVSDRDVALTGVYEGRRRMTLTYPALQRARFVLWLVTGASKAEALSKLMRSDPSIPAARVRAERQLVVADAAAAGDLAER
jgi:6-phosphogluconolactonase